MSQVWLLLLAVKSHLLLLRNFRRNKWEISVLSPQCWKVLLHGSIAVKAQALSSKHFLWDVTTSWWILFSICLHQAYCYQIHWTFYNLFLAFLFKSILIVNTKSSISNVCMCSLRQACYRAEHTRVNGCSFAHPIMKRFAQNCENLKHTCLL